MKKLFENFRKYVNEGLTPQEEAEKKKLKAKKNPTPKEQKRLKVLQHQ